MPLVFLITTLGLDGLLAELNKSHEWLVGTVISHFFLTLLVYFVIYMLLMGLALPCAGLMDLIGGFYFGWAALPIALISVSIGSLPPFFLAKYSLSKLPEQYNNRLFDRLKARFSRNDIVLLCILRVTPWAPFSVTTILAGVLKIKTQNYLIGSTLGFLPWGMALNEMGQGLFNILDYQNLSLMGVLTTSHFLVGAVLLFVISGLIVYLKV
jgi:uncharacterized membrane protein YdjX (TVP38/TMEM64 family)